MALPVFSDINLQFHSYINFPFLGKPVAPHAREILEFAYKQVHSSEEIARKLLLSSTSRLDLEIRVAATKLLHKLYELNSERSPYTNMHFTYPMDMLEDIKRDALSLAEMLKDMAAAIPEFLVAGEDDGDRAVVSSRIHNPKMVGLSDQYEELKHQLMLPTKKAAPFVAVIVGMPGIGKTTVVSKIFEDPAIVAHYDCRLWVTVGRRCQLKEIPRRILVAVDPAGSMGGDDWEIARRLRESLEGKRYLIVLDDVWNKYMACQFRFRSFSNSFESYPLPRGKGNNEGRVLLATRIQQEVVYEDDFPDHVLNMRLLDEEESWDLLREKVFGEDQSCPPQLEEEGKKIAKNCDGLPLTIVTVADLLSKEEKTLQYWSCVAAKKNHKIFMDAYQEISKVLYSSYEELTRVLRMCFLYMGVFPQELEIPRSKLVNMWSVDGFLEPDAHTFQSPSAVEYLDELVSNSLVMIYQITVGLDETIIGRHEVKTCGLHTSLWHLSRREASETKFCHVLSVVDDCSSIQGQSRLSFHNNILFGIKEVCELVENECASISRSLLCYGPYHQYQVPLCFGLKLLRELDALTVRFYEFPMEVLQLVQLKYLALTLNGELPASISKLSKLQFLIVGRHMCIKSPRDSSYLPAEIWDMKELKHLQVMGSDLPLPRGSLENLSTLSNVSCRSCKEGVLRATPNIKKLGIRIELVPGYGGMSLSCLDHLYRFGIPLESLKCVIANPESVVPLGVVPKFPITLSKLSLSGLGYPWEEMNKIASLFALRVLKLRNYAFRGPKWEVKEESSFSSLASLLIEDSNLEELAIESRCLKHLRSLRIKHCYKLQKFRWESDRLNTITSCSLKKIEVIDCNPLGVEQMMKGLPPGKKDVLAIYSSWKDKKLKT